MQFGNERSEFNKCLDDCPNGGPCNEYPWPCMVKEGFANFMGLTIVYDKEKYKQAFGHYPVFSDEEVTKK
jgi:hypothetical protein